MELASDAFISYFENQVAIDAKVINLKEFLNRFSIDKTPTKSILKYELNNEQLVKQGKECVLTNLRLNPHFLNASLTIDYFEPMYSLFKRKNLVITNDDVPRIVFLLHLSKSIFNDFIDFAYLIEQINSIKIVSEQDDYIKELNEIYKKTITNEHLKKEIKKVVQDIIGGDETNYKFEETKLVFFTSSYKGLYGFAGINTVYINQEMLTNMYETSCYDYSAKEKKLLLEISFIRVVLHELSHVAIRFSKNDLNMSSPVEKKREISSQSELIDIEAGALVELNIFKGRIDWHKTAQQKTLSNLKPLYEFIESLKNGQDKPKFNIDIEEVILRTDKIETMAIDFDLHFYHIQME